MTCEQARDLAAAYVLGALEAGEEAAVRDHLQTCDQPHPEFAELGGVVPVLSASLEPVEPPASLRDRIMAAAAADLEARRAAEVSAPSAAMPSVEGPAADRTRPAPTAGTETRPVISLADERTRRRSPLI